jgi:hypothetical protein
MKTADQFDLPFFGYGFRGLNRAIKLQEATN